MNRISSMLAATFAFSALSCTATLSPPRPPTASFGVHVPVPAPTVAVDPGAAPAPGPAPMAAAGPAYGPGDDRHWIQADDFWISDRAYEQGWIRLELAKMKQGPSDQSKGEALFFNLRDTKDQWTRFFYRTRPAEQADFAIGNLILCFEGNHRDGVYHGPKEKKEARVESWFMGRITDTSDLYKGSLMVDHFKCAPDALRAFIQ